MPATYQCGACQATWSEDREPDDCPKCGSRVIERRGRAGSPLEDHYRPPGASVAAGPAITSTSFTVTYWLGLGGFVVALLAFIGAGVTRDDSFAIAAMAAITVATISLSAAYIISLVKLYRGWDAIQPLRRVDPFEADLTSPVAAVGLLFVPFFNLYWNFAAIHGLATKANKYLSLSRIDARPMNESRAQTYCILNVCSLIPFVGIFTALASVVVYYLFIVDVDRMRATLQAWRAGASKAAFVDDFEAL